MRRDASENFTTLSLHCAHRAQFLRIPNPILDAWQENNYNTIRLALIERSLWIFGPVAVQPLVRPRPLLIIKSTRLGGRPQFPVRFRERLYEKQPDYLRNSEMIYRRDFLQHVGWGDQPISVGAFRIHVQLLFAKRSRRLRFFL